MIHCRKNVTWVQINAETINNGLFECLGTLEIQSFSAILPGVWALSLCSDLICELTTGRELFERTQRYAVQAHSCQSCGTITIGCQRGTGIHIRAFKLHDDHR